MQTLTELKIFLVTLNKDYTFDQHLTWQAKVEHSELIENTYFAEYEPGHAKYGSFEHIKINFRPDITMAEFMNFLKDTKAEYGLVNYNVNNTLDWWLDEEGEFDLSFHWPENPSVIGTLYNVPATKVEELITDDQNLVRTMTVSLAYI